MKLIPGWRQAWRLWSVRVSALGALLSAIALGSPDAVATVWNALPPELLAKLPHGIVMAVPTILFVASAAARVIKQREATDGAR